ncbi:hypothetical protein PoB_006304900 [Plakobranchus ocellatus]|uniref:Uncharacterized protein n=1 Tax=Plakobranchus ocellatus TaxID=259542 RepID=A0AAV4CXA8_9GAST|nr:hypothetical protein PoB_006304900 [Plakobranchus ocellatus]
MLREEFAAAKQTFKCGKTAGADNFFEELLKRNWFVAAEDILTALCSKIIPTGKCLTPWAQTLITVLPKNGATSTCNKVIVPSA